MERTWKDALEQGEGSVVGALKAVAGGLKNWSSNILGDLEKRAKKLKKELEFCRKREITKEQVAREGVLRYRLEKVEEQIDVYWRQRAHVRWLKEGDRNTAFFHAACSERRRCNKIGRIQKDDGSWVEEEEEKKAFIANYFLNLFRSDVQGDSQQILDTVERKVTSTMNEMLLAPFTEVDIKEALDSIGDLKAPGPDGMPAIFYKNFWSTVGRKVVEEVMQVLNGGDMPASWNETTVVLIPKVPKPESVKNLRPISLCNVMYKLVSKVLANRLKQVLPDVISPSQSAFVPGRLISDNILIAYEITHYMRRKKKGKTSYAAVKLDMSKAYDRVEWSFLKQMMVKLGFNQRWVELIMICVSSVTYRVRVNGDLTESFVPERGLRQGDPLSPYLFQLCAEGFSSLLKKAEDDGSIKGVTICHNAPSVSHLLFADDSLIVFRANGEDAQQLQSLLQVYEQCSGQKINKDKTAVMFSANVREEDKQEVMNALNIPRETANERYLGLPVFIGKSRRKAFEFLKDRIWKRMQGWKEKMLSNAGKEILIKAVAQAIPTYAMGCFEITKDLCDQISAMICRYWWSSQEKEKKLHWIRWEKLMRPKGEGGLGFKDIYTFNLAMLARQGWWLVQNKESLCCRILGAKYFPGGDVLQAVAKPCMSYSWRSILKGVQVLKKGIILAS